MDKGTKKKPKYNHDAILVLRQRYGYSDYYLRQCINGAKNEIIPDQIRKEYHEIVKQLDLAKDKLVKEFIKK